MRRGERLLLGLSGGIDSTYLAWRLLRRGHPLVLHHCTYVTRQNRYPEEERAHRSVLDWLTSQGLTDWELRTSHVSIQDLTGYVHNDNDVLYWLSGMMLRSPDRQDIRTMVRTSTANDSSPTRPSARRRERLLNLVAEREVRLAYPVRPHSKAALIGDMPRELFELTWWCRRPRDGAPCHRCHTCRLVDAATGYEPEAAPPETAEPKADVPAPPPQSATKAVWVAYAVSRGVDQAEAEAMTKASLVEAYGR